MKRLIKIARKPRRRTAFTLVELLTVIAIIGMLGAISISTVRVSIETAKASQTETTIARIDSALTAIYEKYQYRRVDLSGRTFGSNEERAAARVGMTRDLLRCDLPCVPNEMTTDSAFGGTTPLQQSYRTATTNADGTTKFRPDENGNYPNANAELLYLVVTNADPESRLLFSDREVGDVDGNGLFEFIDGWGRPICWLRWAPGLASSDRQPTFDLVLSEKLDPKLDADPFNPLELKLTNSTNNQTSTGWFLVPYIFSAGPDGEYGLNPPLNTTDVAVMNDPFTPALNDPANAPGAPDGAGTDKDNINNHTLIR